jgi:hypothetical protein
MTSARVRLIRASESYREEPAADLRSIKELTPARSGSPRIARILNFQDG